MNLSIQQKIEITCEYNHTWIHHPLLIKFLIDDKIIHLDVSGKTKNNFKKKIVVNHDQKHHEFAIQISNKTNENVKFDANLKTIEDTLFEIKDLQFDKISILSMLESGGFGKFYVENSKKIKTNSLILGENGILKFSFNTPLDAWLLENLF